MVARFEVPILWRLLQAFSTRDAIAVNEWTERFVAARDTAEFRAETIQMGYSLAKLATDLKLDDGPLLSILQAQPEVPLGQVAGQRLLLSLQPELEIAAQQAQQLADHELSNWSPGLSMQHEVQYSRLYRS